MHIVEQIWNGPPKTRNWIFWCGQKIAPNNPGKLLYPPFRQCIFENSLFQNGAYLISFDNDNSSATIKVWSNFHFSFSIILCLVQKKWYVQKIPRGGWSGFGTALIWIDPNFHENCLDWSKLFYLYPNSIQTGGVVQFCPNNSHHHYPPPCHHHYHHHHPSFGITHEAPLQRCTHGVGCRKHTKRVIYARRPANIYIPAINLDYCKTSSISDGMY